MKQRAVILVLACTAAACSISACSRSTQKPLAENMTIRLAYATNPNAALVHIALEKGYFASEGLTVIPSPHDFGKLALDSVFTGNSDLATVADTPIVFAALEDKPVGIAAVIATSDRTTALVADRSASVEYPKDLAGKSIGVAKGTSSEFFLELLLRARGVDRKHITILDMLPGDLLPAFQDGKIQAAVVWNPYLLQLQESLASRVVTMYGEDFYTEQFYLAGNRDFMTTHPEAMVALMKALIKAENFFIHEPDGARTIIATYSKTVPELFSPTLIRFRVNLDGSSIMILDEETRWAASLNSSKELTIPDYMKVIYAEALSTVAPERVRIIR